MTINLLVIGEVKFFMKKIIKLLSLLFMFSSVFYAFFVYQKLKPHQFMMKLITIMQELFMQMVHQLQLIQIQVIIL